MDDSFLNPLQLWRGRAAASLAEPAQAAPLPLPLGSLNLADEFFWRESLTPPGRARRREEGVEPYTMQWFLRIEELRYERFGRWIPRLMEFTKHSGETMLGLGGGLGTDWVAYARGGANVIGCSSSTDELSLARRNFELRGLKASFLHADAAVLPIETASIDVVAAGTVLGDAIDPAAVVREVYRVLKPGGKVIAVAPARYDVEFWSSVWFPWRRLFARKTIDPAPVRYAGRDLSKLFQQFSEHRVSKRQLTRFETPHLWRWMPRSLLERIAGRCLVVRAFKPLSAAMSAPLAA